jgi:hypothetical protein
VVLEDGGKQPEPDELPFGLSASGESIYLLDEFDNEIDSVVFGSQESGWSYGRPPHSSLKAERLLSGGSPGRLNWLDSDEDGLGDEWEALYGFDPFANDPILSDQDSDGATNLEEFLAGTSPIDPTEKLLLHSVSCHDLGISLGFDAKQGHGYALEISQDLTHWSMFWEVDLLGADRTVDLTLSMPSSGGPHYFRLISN